MADAGPNYTIERRRLELATLEHRQTIKQGQARLSQIDGQKQVNLARAELANEELDEEARKILANEAALTAKIAENDTNLKLMVKAPKEPVDG